MGCNPCCCWKLKDAAVTIGIWSTIFCIIQLAIFGWQMAAIKYEKDRAANTLLPNYNTYGRYDIPSYYESYWQSPEERYYTGLFVIQILCLISSFFLLASSIMFIYGVYSWSRYLVWPWFICMSSSILTSLAYCIMWWAGDVRDYWLVLTILEIFAVFLNCYCFVVICVFYKRMLIELEYYEGNRTQKYNRFNQRETPQFSNEQDFDDDNFRGDQGYMPQQQWDTKYPQDPFPPYNQPPSYPQQPYLPMDYQKSQCLPQKPQNQFDQTGFTGINAALPLERFDPNQVRPRSAMTGVQASTQFENFQEVPRQEHRKSQRHRSCPKYDCHHSRHRHHSGTHHRHHHHHHHHNHKSHSKHHRRNGSSHHRRKGLGDCSYSSEACSTADYSGTESGISSRLYHNLNTFERKQRSSRSKKLGRLSDGNESDFTSDSTDQYHAPSKGTMQRQKSVPADARRPHINKSKRSPMEQQFSGGEAVRREQSEQSIGITAPYAGGISIPQHIVIPPSTLLADSANERKYQINSEITISYDPRKQSQTTDPIDQSGSGREPSNLTISPTLFQPKPISITSNV